VEFFHDLLPFFGISRDYQSSFFVPLSVELLEFMGVGEKTEARDGVPRGNFGSCSI